MKTYLLSLGAGLLVGAAYGLIGVRSPAPPVIALVGLLGILLGEQVAPAVKRLLAGCSLPDALAHTGGARHILGHLPGPGSRERDDT